MPQKLILLLISAATLLWVAGCSDNPVVNQPSSNSDIASQFDGLTATSEAAAFGDPSLAAEAGDEVEVTDPVAATPACDSLLNDPNAGLFHFRAVWGRLRYDSTSTIPTNWDGSLTISRGLEVVRRAIRFEPRTDSLLPRVQRNLIEWASITTVHNDGIAVDILIPPARPIFDTTITIVVDSMDDTTFVIDVDTIPAPPVTVEFKTGPYTRVFTLPELARLDTIIYLDDSNAVAFSAYKFDHFICPRGSLAGHWGFDSTGAGVFRGMWIGLHGEITGYLQGHFQTDSAGQKVFFGKWIDQSGQFEGLLKGTWGRHPNKHASERGKVRGGGWFAGQIFNANADPIGILRGHYKGAENLNSGFFQGRWKLNCPGMKYGDDGMDDDPEDDND